MRKLTVILLSVAIALLGLTTASLAKNPKAYWNTPQEYEKATGNKIKKFNEAPMLRTMVAAGELPPMKERLPEDPQVIVPVEEIGQYGGTWRTYYGDPGMGHLKMIMYDTAVRWSRDIKGYIPGLARKWEFSNDDKTITFHFRKGVKWSDGYPFTMEDLRFWWEDLATNDEYEVILPPWWAYNDDRTLMEVRFIDDYTMSFTFKEPHYLVPLIMANGFWEWEPLMKPKHYLKQFHPRYNPKIKDYITFQDKDKWWQNPDYPILYAWHTVEYIPGKRVIFERNPYYWKVDTAGNQLPYIDRIEAEYVKETEVLLLKAIRGEYDCFVRGLEGTTYLPVLKEKEKAGDYRIILWTLARGGDPVVYINQTYNKEKDPFMHDLLRNKYFRRALSYAIDRKRIIDVVWGGFGTPQQATASKECINWLPWKEGGKIFKKWANSWIEYDPEKANELLDEIGLNKRDKEGFRTRPDGSNLTLIVNIYAGHSPKHKSEFPQLLKEYWQAIGLRIILNPIYGTPEETLSNVESTYQLGANHSGGAPCDIDWWTYPAGVFPIGGGDRCWPGVTHWYSNRPGYKEKPEPGSPEERLIEIYEKGLKTADFEKRNRIFWEAARVHIEEGPFEIGVAGDIPTPVLAKNNFRNVPNFGIIAPWAVGCPGSQNPEQFFFKK